MCNNKNCAKIICYLNYFHYLCSVMKDLFSTLVLSLVTILIELVIVAFLLFVTVGLLVGGTSLEEYFMPIYWSTLGLIGVIFTIITFVGYKYIFS